MKKITTTLLLILAVVICQAQERKFFVFEPDIRIFTSYCLMNAAGFDSDWKTPHSI